MQLSDVCTVHGGQKTTIDHSIINPFLDRLILDYCKINSLVTNLIISRSFIGGLSDLDLYYLQTLIRLDGIRKARAQGLHVERKYSNIQICAH